MDSVWGMVARCHGRQCHGNCQRLTPGLLPSRPPPTISTGYYHYNPTLAPCYLFQIHGMSNQAARAHTSQSNRAKARSDADRKTIFKSVVDNPFRVQWYIDALRNAVSCMLTNSS